MRIMASGILALVRTMLMILQSFVIPRPESAADGHKLNGHKGFAESDDDQIVDRNRQNIFFVEEKGSNRSGRNTKAPVTMSPQTARILNEILYPFRIRSGFFAP